MRLHICGTSAKWSAVSAASNPRDVGEKVRRKIAEVESGAPGSICKMLQFQFDRYDPENNDFTMTCETMPWMQNSMGTLHGGLCATILDQAMGYVTHCLKTGEGFAPTIQLKVDYHRPLHPGERVIVKVHVVSVTRSLVNLTAEAFQATRPDKICLSGSGLFFCKTKD